MNLTIDIGNTKVKLGFFKNDILIKKKETHASSIKKELEDCPFFSKCKKAIVCSVSEIPTGLIDFLTKIGTVIQFTTDTKLPIQSKYQSPETLGKDRLAAVIGSLKEFNNTNRLIIDAGTCVTFDFINAENQYLGGAIAPGISMRYKSLHAFTQKLPLVVSCSEKDIELIGNTTENSIKSGVQIGFNAEIKGIIDTYNKQYPSLKTIVTGGDIVFFDNAIKKRIFADPNLVLKGLNIILNYNASN